MSHPGRVRVGEGQVGAPPVGRDGVVGDGEVPHRQFGDLRLRRGRRGRLAQPRPAGRGERRIGQVDDLAVRGVRRERHRVGVGDRRGDDLLGGRLPGFDPVAVVPAGPVAAAACRPDAGAVVAAHRHRARRSRRRVGQFEGDGAGGGRPDREGGHLTGEADPERGVGGGAVDVVEHAGDLHPGRAQQHAPGVPLGHHELPAQRRRHLRQVGPVEPERLVGPQVREGRPLGLGEPVALRPQRQRGVRPGQLAVDHAQPTLRGGHQGVRPAVGRADGPGDRGPVDPLRLLFRDVQVLRRPGAGGGQQPAGHPAQQPDLVADPGQVESLVVGLVLGVTPVDDVVQPGRPGRQRHRNSAPNESIFSGRSGLDQSVGVAAPSHRCRPQPA